MMNGCFEKQNRQIAFQFTGWCSFVIDSDTSPPPFVVSRPLSTPTRIIEISIIEFEQQSFID